MTFAELAASRGISKESAISLVRRKGWRRQRDNRGHVIALVPNDGPELRRSAPGEADRPPNHQGDYQANAGAFETALAAIQAAHAAEVALLRDRLDMSDKDRIAMQVLADRLGAQLADAGERGDRLERDLAAASDRAEKALAQASVLQTTINELRAGQTLMAETHARDLAAVIQQAQDAAEETIRQRVERLEHDRATSVAIADEAVRAAEQLRQAATDGKGRGRWARLRAAWRGE